MKKKRLLIICIIVLIILLIGSFFIINNNTSTNQKNQETTNSEIKKDNKADLEDEKEDSFIEDKEEIESVNNSSEFLNEKKESSYTHNSKENDKKDESFEHSSIKEQKVEKNYTQQVEKNEQTDSNTTENLESSSEVESLTPKEETIKNQDEQLWEEFKKDPLTLMILDTDAPDWETKEDQQIESQKWIDLGYRVEEPYACLNLQSGERCVYGLLVFMSKGVCNETPTEIQIDWRKRNYIGIVAYAKSLGYECKGYQD